MRRTDASSGMFGNIRKRGIAALGAGLLLGAGVLVMAPQAARATATPDCPAGSPDNDCFSGASNNITASAGVPTGTITVGTVTDTDQGGDISAIINWGDGSTSPGTVNGYGGDITGSHTYANGGTYPLTIDITDGDEPTTTLANGDTGTTELTDGTATVVGDVSGSTVSFSATEGQLAGPGVVANFTDLDSSCGINPGELTAQINWGDGVSSPGTVNCTSGSGGTVTGSHTYNNDEGTSLPITVDMTDADEPSVTLPSGNSGNAELSGGTVTILDAAITPSATPRNAVEGAGFSASLGTITDAAGAAANPADYSVALTCYNDTGPGGSPTPPANKPADCVPASLSPVQNHPGQFLVNGSGVFNEEGVFDVQTFITDGESPGPVQEMSTMDSYVTVADAALTVSPVSTIQAKKGNTFSKIVANFKDADPQGTTSDYTASINWGDGTTTSGTIAPNGTGGWSVTGSHKYTTAKGFAVTVTVNDSGGATNSTVTQVRAK